THGRSFWILDNITLLRQLTAEVAAAEVFLYRPQLATRVRWNMNTDTPLPPEEPAAKNPPDGAMIDYHLKSAAKGPVTLEILDSQGKLVRRYNSADKPEQVNEKSLDVPTYWIRPPQMLSADAGVHRFVWDLHYAPPPGGRRSYHIAAILRDTASEPHGPWAMPAQYLVKLTVDGQSLEQPLTVRMDPRVKTPSHDLAQQFAVSMQCYQGIQQMHEASLQLRKVRTQLRQLREEAGDRPLGSAIADLDKKLSALDGRSASRREMMAARSEGANEPSLNRVHAELVALLDIVQQADLPPTTQAVEGSRTLQPQLLGLLSRWRQIKDKDIPALNERLREGKLNALSP
ncbi:MAG TPA: hypothetical protein VGY58_06095, partial [Gemmataceae bacterium]|nr:hypothetical protein [Gemmataceae bacterium]